LEFTAPSSCGHGIFDFSVGFEEVSKYQSARVEKGERRKAKGRSRKKKGKKFSKF
jgi:hypothetical protein